jgi:hypothetical protein
VGTIWNTPPNCKVLEIHLYGGLSPWETFYVRPPTAANRFRGFDTEMSALPFACDALTDTEPAPFGTDALNQPVYLSRFTKPLWRSSIISRTRVVVQRHELLPHEAAIPYAITGFTLGSPNLAGLGASIQRRYRSLDEVNGTVQPLPYAYVCWPASFSFPTDNLQASAAIGRHPGSARPLVLKIANDNTAFIDSLQRPGRRTGADDLLRQFRGQYSAQLAHTSLASGARARAKAFDSYEASLESVLQASALQTVLSGSPLAGPLRQDADCPDFFTQATLENMPGTAIRLSAYLLANSPARYAFVVDKGLQEHPMGGGYDTHGGDHINHHGVNLWNVLGTLRELIDAGTLDLNTTLVVLTTEFGRTPTRSGNGRDHWPFGYVNVLIGGPVTQGVAGAIASSATASVDGLADAVGHYNPADVRAAVLLAAGIYPFENEGFGVRDLSFGTPTSQHRDLLLTLKTDVLGAPATA